MPEQTLPEEIRKQIENTETQELSLEVLEIVMSKVQDIDRYGTAYSNINRYTEDPQSAKILISSIMRNGILGLDGYDYKNADGEEKRIIESWREYLKSAKWARKNADETTLFKSSKHAKFNIVGRNIKEGEPVQTGKTEIEQGMYSKKFETESLYPYKFTVIFDVSKFQEREVGVGGIERSYNRTEKDFRPLVGEHRRNSKGDSVTREGMGFGLSGRVPPRVFRGIAIDYPENVEFFKKEMKSVYKDKPKMLLPIYDLQGNLLWPKQMSYEKVQKFVAEKNKTQNLPSEIG